jgi:group II intron reverse transcriptase/maturase
MGSKPKVQGVRSPHISPRRESRLHGEGGDRAAYRTKETDSGHEGSDKSLQTSLREISKKAGRNKSHRFGNLYTMLTKEVLLEAIGLLNPKAAAGVDGITFEEYVVEAESHAERLIKKLKNKSYRAKLVRRQYILKSNGKMRPLGIPAMDDKVLQLACARILEAIFDPNFYEHSYGYRRGLGAHDALRELKLSLQFKPVRYVVEADIKGFFDNLDHKYLLQMLEQRVNDKAFINLISKWLKAGVLEGVGEIVYPVSGTPQGGIISPILANIYLDHVLDQWFIKEVQPVINQRGNYCNMVRYADDFVCVFYSKEDAQQFYATLQERLGKFKLDVEPSKTKLLLFSKYSVKQSESFTFLSFDFYMDHNTKGTPQVKMITSRKKLQSSIREFKEWIIEKKDTAITKLMKSLKRKYQGYYNYYAFSMNSERLGIFYNTTQELLMKWLNRRSQRKSYNWTGFRALMRAFEIPTPKITVSGMKRQRRNIW